LDAHITLTIRQEEGGSAAPATVVVPVGTPVELGRLDPSAPDAEQLFVPLTGARVRISNLSSSVAVWCIGHPAIGPGATLERQLPLELRISTLSVTPAAGAVFLFENGGWRPAAIDTAGDTAGERTARPSTSVLRRVLKENRTCYSRVDPTAGVLTSIAAIDAYVAAPILDRDDGVIGAIYGHRSRALVGSTSAEISHLEALLVQTLASDVAAGLARLVQEKASLARKAQFEFFSPELAA
jgi:hypothetical protein